MDLLVTLTLSDRLFALLEDKLPNLGRRMEKAITKEIGAQIRRETGISIATPVPKPSEVALQVEAVDSKEKPADGEKPAPVEAEIQAPKFPTVEDCRAALNRTRIRFEGEDYENKTSEGFKKYHKAITSQIKQIVMAVSGGRADKIPSLPEDCRAAFIAECDALTLDENGNITPPNAPF